MLLTFRGLLPAPRWAKVRSTVAIVMLAQLAIACVTAAPGRSLAGSVASTAAITTPVEADRTAGASQPSSTGPISAISPPPSSAGPPPATLAAEGGDRVAGQLGSYTWDGGGSDSPWLPGAPVNVGAGEPLTVTVAGGVSVGGWSARRVPAGTKDGAGAAGLGRGDAPVTFSAPGPGSWSVQVAVRFAGGLGSAAYYWQLTVR